MFNSTEDDDFFTPTSSNNLASLFSSSVSSPNNSNVVLTYNAPKKPKQPAEEEISRTRVEKLKGQSSVVCAKPVSLYKKNGSYLLLGKYGLALMGTALQADEIILYKDKRNILKRVKISLNFKFTLQNNRFLCFTDDNKQIWSMSFEFAKDINEFVQNLETRSVSVVHLETEKGSNIKQLESVYNNAKTEIEGQDLVNESNEVITSSPSSQTRADILSRMAKMGQSILPNTVLKSNILSDSETDDSSTNKIILNRKSKIKKDFPTVKEKHNENIKTVTTASPNVQPVIPMAQLIPSYTVPHVTQSLPSNMIMSTLPSTVENLNLNMYITESRLHNSEVRMNMSTISSKMDNILAEITKLKFPSNTDQLENDFLKAKINTLETKVMYLSKTLEEKEQTKENELAKLNHDIKLKDKTIQQEKEKYILLEKQLSEESMSLKEYIEKLKFNEEELKKIIEIQQVKLNDLDTVCENSKSSVDNLQNIIENLNEEIRCLNETLNDLKSKCSNSEKTKIKLFSESTKQSMNVMYQNILKDFTGIKPDNNIQGILASSLKQATYEIMQHFRNSIAINNDKSNINDTDFKKGAPPVPEF